MANKSKTLVLYYSHTGNNKYLAKQISKELNSDIEELQPKMGAYFLHLMSTAFGLSPGTKPPQKDLKKYQAVILVGPLWMGKPSRTVTDIIKKQGSDVKNLYFITCCGSSDEKKNDKFGYGNVFPKVQKLYGKKKIHCEALPIGLALPKDKRDDDEAMMNARLSNENFDGEPKQRLDRFLDKVRKDMA